MAGERLHPDGWTEISAVAVDEEHRRQGLRSAWCSMSPSTSSSAATGALLHASATNTAAITGYEQLGFALRRRLSFGAVRTPLNPGRRILRAQSPRALFVQVVVSISAPREREPPLLVEHQLGAVPVVVETL